MVFVSIACMILRIYRVELGDNFAILMIVFQMVGLCVYSASLSPLAFVYVIETLPERGFIITAGSYWVSYYIVTTVTKLMTLGQERNREWMDTVTYIYLSIVISMAIVV